MEVSKFKTLGQWSNKAVTHYQLEKVYIKNPEEVQKKLKQMIADGPEQLQVVTDFDQTITAFEYGGQNSLATFSIFRMSQHSPEKFRENMHKLFNFYSPLERDQQIKYEQKHLMMEEWYTKVSEQFNQAQFSKEKADLILNDSNIALRYLFEQFFTMCHQKQIPFYIVSGGVDLVCHTILNSLVSINEYRTLEVISNQLVLVDDVITELKMVVTATSKSQVLSSHHNPPQRKNTLLLGDLPSDYYMTQHMNDHNQISIGFVSYEQEKNLADYTKLFDIVIAGEPTYLIPVTILAKIYKQGLGAVLEEHLQYPEYKPMLDLLI